MKKRIDLEWAVRGNIRELEPYSSARSESSLKGAIYLDANENPYNNGFNRYPQPINRKLKSLAASSFGQMLNGDNIFVGNGSDEAIDLLIRIFCTPGEDNIVSITPTYGMYRVAAAINGVEYREAQLQEDFSLDGDKVLELCDNYTKMVFLCSPNNPTANLLDKNQVINILDSFRGVVVVDEAYIDFSGERGFSDYLEQYQNLVLLRTLSKSKGMAAIRVGFAIADPQIISYMERIKYPYNLNSSSQQMAIKSLEEESGVVIGKILKERNRLATQLPTIEGVELVYPSDTNFLLVKFKEPKRVAALLKEQGVVVRDRSDEKGCEGALRITVGKSKENSLLLSILRGEDVKNNSLGIEFSRVTAETNVNLTIYKEPIEQNDIDSGVRFLDHMLELFARHSGCGLDLFVRGDLDVDAHHTIEDIAIVLGEAIGTLYRGASSYKRYGFVLPMDESRAEVLIDLGGRAAFVWDVEFTCDMSGDFPTQMYKHFFDTLASSGRFALHMKASGENDHHIAESLFKAFGRALRVALSKSVDDYEIPSSKGVI